MHDISHGLVALERKGESIHLPLDWDWLFLALRSQVATGFKLNSLRPSNVYMCQQTAIGLTNGLSSKCRLEDGGHFVSSSSMCQKSMITGG